MAAGAPVVASDLPAFVRVLQAEPGGTLAGELFPNEDADALAERLLALLGDAAERARLGAAGRSRARIFDWSVVAEDIIAVYETVTHPGAW